MTELLIDIGNSRCKYAYVEKHHIKAHGTLALEQIDALPTSVRKYASAIPKACYIMSVADHNTNSFVAKTVEQYLGYTPILLDKKMPLCGVNSNYHPTQLGIDRVAAIIAAWRRLKQACIVIDCGTAVTVDLIDDKGVHQGGVILPSDKLMRSLLSQATAQLDYFDDSNRPVNIFATNTEDAIVFGCRLTLTSGLFAIVQKMREQFKCDIPVVATGGASDLIENAVGNHVIENLSFIPTLNFEGMMALMEETV